MTNSLKNSAGNAADSLENLKIENRALKELLTEALEAIKGLKNLQQIQEQQPRDEYNRSWTVVSKVVFLITKADKPLRSAEIIPLLREREPKFIEKQVSFEKYLSAFLNTAVKHERLITYKLKGVRGNFYCLPQWIEENGALIPEMRKKIF